MLRNPDEIDLAAL